MEFDGSIVPDRKQRWGRGNRGGKLHKKCFMEVLGFQEENKAKSTCRHVSLAAEALLARVASFNSSWCSLGDQMDLGHHPRAG